VSLVRASFPGNLQDKSEKKSQRPVGRRQTQPNNEARQGTALPFFQSCLPLLHAAIAAIICAGLVPPLPLAVRNRFRSSLLK